MSSGPKGKRVLVIGASGGIGEAAADAFSAAGAEVLRPRRDGLDMLDEAGIAIGAKAVRR